MRIKFLGVLSVCVLAVVVLALPASGLGTQESTSMYIVQLVQAPVAGYAGGVDGYAATKPGKGKKVDASSASAQKYAGYLKAAHDNALRKVGGGDKVYDYTTVFNGFAAPLTDGQAEKLRGADDTTPAGLRVRTRRRCVGIPLHWPNMRLLHPAP